MEKTWCVYKHTNRENGKVYIGITSQNPRDRWDSGWGYQRNKHFWDAIRKYGWDTFEHEVLYTDLSFEAACEKECELIDEYQSRDYNKGYNLAPGGGCGPGLSGSQHPMYGTHWSEKQRARMSAVRKGVPYSSERYQRFLETLDREELRRRAYRTIAGWNKGKPVSEEVKRKMAESNRGQKRSEETKRRIGAAKAKPVLQFTKNGEFVQEWDSAVMASEKLDISRSYISKVCTNKAKTAGGFVWRYKETI